ncbi:TlpA family protein disulfide reductase [Mucilaginibacter sp.]|uniref:TlpA family protein disulfide reductase n=1 Tax=Mucilaginibacter sp. TaxID=1882438 RepID=UPI003D0B72BE
MKTSFFTLCLIAIISFTKAQPTNPLINQQAKPVIFQQNIGKQIPKDFYKGKILVLDFWATWCAPCIANFPHFNKLADTYQGKDVVFAIMSDEPIKMVQHFFDRTKKQVNALKLIDTTKSTMQAFNIEFIPYSIVIDKNNIIRWIGSGELLTDDVLSKIINNAPSANPLMTETKQATPPLKKAFVTKPLFSFNVTLADTTSKGEQGGGASSHDNDFISYSIKNATLGYTLEEVTGYSKKVRIISNDTTKLNKLINLNFDSKFDTTLFKRYANTLLPGKPRKNLIVSLLADAFKFDATVIKVTKKHYELMVKDTAKLKTFVSMQKEHSSFSDDYFPKFEIVGFSLKAIAPLLESSAKLIITSNSVDDNRYDISLDISNMKTLQQTLKFHGLELKEVIGEVNLLNITFN